ncbi:hypothetical protein E2C01_074909 [Portunus trituberculatus]|uniref:Tyr recombinase domain-containing protein n=1 Tax=Portunus trituberculatus TaxID=210409 RepID=A0A5B7I4P2_PORTR|nr:hypothetical protein [Portunus trituberculatus]
MFHVRRRAVPTVATYVAALADPLSLEFNITIRGRVLDLLKKGHFHQRPPVKRPRIFWSLSKSLRKALFLVAMVSGLRGSQLHALIRHPSWLVFSRDGRRVSLAPFPKFLAKNEREGHSLAPIVLQAWMEGLHHHPFCPVESLRRYVGSTSDPQHTRLFIWPDTHKPLSRIHISKVLCGVTEEADPGHAPKGHEVRAMSATMAFLRHFSLD